MPSVMDDLVRWLGKQLDEDERIARRVESSWRQIGETGVIVASDGERAEECANGNWTGIAEHIVQHDPARVLREVEADRQLLATYTDAQATIDALTHPDMYDVGRAQGLEEAVRHRALRLDGRAGYREEWRP
ncbi:DUF6221 family protein [Streptomyces kroppenstedtii]|uniref:DUF6221 family protein n=1 Tax=Streptomyces kroppenstedtii TaxID=3051181 RepID=UPI0028D156B1|nr:DUF6221 family protein [Streptomyces sp. DSM 40484]